jgi:hypothetical protein
MRRSSAACSSFHQVVIHPPTDLLPLNPFASPKLTGLPENPVSTLAEAGIDKNLAPLRLW